MKNKIIIALDFSSLKEVKNFLKGFKREKLFLKVGMELYFKYQNKIIKYLKKRKHQLFIDLKIHDIPNTTYKAAKNLLDMEPDIISVHASGGLEMLKSIVKAKKDTKSITKLFAVTYLTSIDEQVLTKELKINKDLITSIKDLASLTYNANLDGVVCSVWESRIIKDEVSKKLLTLTPGIRITNMANDQKRVATIKDAVINLSDYIVVGREITNSKNPYFKYVEMNKEWNNE
ncbi:orotidine-5'-phosphate decarboxylase [Spiroplasma corruscae]|uniref:Orotidine 5'-phosphate decarboxylase n=1 Tax=Spiroplasma corruscae TaxID=216934 RepID=A0A222EPV4_9MOLU|nr:orotidine-5'-phosphate decarboxylase [Spiroplasma corruscae]ASP28482.1 orotidine-5'-phosphate decarboxylase [Spiroplasma corruscae]